MTDHDRAELYADALADILRMVGDGDGLLEQWVRDRAEVALEIGEAASTDPSVR